MWTPWCSPSCTFFEVDIPQSSALGSLLFLDNISDPNFLCKHLYCVCITLWMTPLFVGMYHSPMSGRLKLKPFPPYVVKIQSCSFTINVSKNYFIWSWALTLGNIWFLWTERPRGKHPLDFHNEQLGSCTVCGAPWINNLPWLFFGKYSTKEK